MTIDISEAERRALIRHYGGVLAEENEWRSLRSAAIQEICARLSELAAALAPDEDGGDE